MHPHRLQQLVATVPDGLSPEQRARLYSHVDSSDACRIRIDRTRDELRDLLDGGAAKDEQAASRSVDLACELDVLERVQQRLDGWLMALVEELTQAPRVIRYDDGVPA
ncbi:hypothetical protein WEH80_25670 [Actinomycetes bacterium KLBMP 9759]